MSAPSSIPSHPFSSQQIVDEPLKLVDHVFQQSINQSSTPLNNIVNDLGISNIIKTTFELPDRLSLIDGSIDSLIHRSNIPSMNVVDQSKQAVNQSMKQGSLVRFRGRVCDTYNPELYCGVYHYTNENDQAIHRGTGKYRDVIDQSINQSVNLSHPDTKHSERLTVRLTPIPGETEWVKRVTNQQATQSINPQTNPSDAADLPANRINRKRAIDSVDESVDDSMVDESADPAKRTRSEVADQSANQLINSINDADSVIVTLYDRDMNRLKVGDLIEVIGVYSFNPSLAESADESMEELNDLYTFPRIHAINILPIDCSVDQSAQHAVEQSRQSLLELINQSTMGDQLMAELLLLGMLSHVHSRDQSTKQAIKQSTIGPLSINLISEQRGSSIYQSINQLINQLYVSVIPIELSVTSLNSRSFIPTKDYSDDRLIHSVLASQKNTAFLIDETNLTNASMNQLNETGLSNIRSVQSMMDNQTLSCDFKYHVIELPADVNHFTVSKQASILNHSLAIKHQPDQSNNQSINQSINDEKSHEYRRYINWCRSLSFSIPESFSSTIETTFLTKRKDQTINQTINAEWLHEVLSVSRWLSISHGHSELTLPIFDRAVKLVEMRRERLI